MRPAPNQPVAPPGFRLVTWDDFIAALGPLNVHPSVANPDVTLWELPDRRVLGRSLGWKRTGEQKFWMLKTA